MACITSCSNVNLRDQSQQSRFSCNKKDMFQNVHQSLKKLLTLPQWVKRVCWAKLPLLLNKQMHQLLNKRPKYKSQLKIMKNSEINSDHLYTIYLTWWGRLRGWSCKGQTFTFFETKHLTNATLKHLERFFIINYASIF